MKRAVLFLFVLLVTVARAWSTGESAPTIFSGADVMVFRNGENGYDGIRFYGIDAESTGVTVGDMSWDGDSLIWVGDVNGDDNLKRVVWSADISALSDSAVILSADLYVLKVDHTYGATTQSAYGVYRLFRPFDDEPTWLARKGATDPDTTWITEGVLPAAGTGPRWAAFGASSYPIRAGVNEYTATATELDSIGGYPIAMASDSLYSGYSQIAAPTDYRQDALSAPDVATWGRYGLSNNDAWVRFDVTHLVSAWHYGQWANHGAALSPAGPEHEENDLAIQVHGCFPANMLQPFLVVRYINCTWPE